MRALVTRPQEDAEGIAAALAGRGIEVVIEPLLRIHPVAGVALDLAGVQAVLATSANGVRALAAATAERQLPVYAVGDASARCARTLGFRTVESAGGDAEALVGLVRRRLAADGGALIHAAGTAVAGDISGALSQAGYDVRRVVLYDAQEAEALSPGLTAELRAGAIDLSLFFSPRTAASFARLVAAAGLEGYCRAVTAYCLSAAVASRLEGLPWRRLRVAARPDQPALLAAIDADLHEDIKTG